MKELWLFVAAAGEKPNALAEPSADDDTLTKKGKKKKNVHWAEEEQLKHYFYFDLDETERGTKSHVWQRELSVLLSVVNNLLLSPQST